MGPRLWERGRTQKTNILGVIFHAYGEKNPWSDLHKILHWGDIQDVITVANFAVDRLRGFNVARGQILGFSIGSRRRPYNTVALPCERVISQYQLSDYGFICRLSFDIGYCFIHVMPF